jgi:streptogramin lyase
MEQRRWLCALVALSLGAGVGCRRGVDAAQFGAVTRARRAIKLFTDSDSVTGAAAGSVELYVATLRGVLRYPLDGRGEPQRNTVANGLPDDRVYATAVSPDGVPYVATAGGVARLAGDRWERTSGPQPDVGRVSALLALSRNVLLLGGSHGLAEYRDGAWVYVTTQHQVTNLTMDNERVVVSTAQSGLFVLGGDHLSGEEHLPSAGFPAPFVRSVVPVGEGRLWALTQDVGGARLAYWDGHRWYAYTHARLRNAWLALVPSRDGRGASLVLQGRWFDLMGRDGRDEGSLDLLAVSEPDGQRRMALRATPVPPGTVPGASANPGPSGSSGAGITAASILGGGRGGSRGGGGGGGGGADMSFTAEETGSPAQEQLPRVRAVDIPGPIAPIEGPGTPPTGPNGERLSGPSFSLAPASVPMPDDSVGVFVDGARVYAAREGRGVVRVTGGEARTFAIGDLKSFPRGLQFTSDGEGRTWFLGSDGVMLGYDGRRWLRRAFRDMVSVEDEDPRDAQAISDSVPLALWSRGQVHAVLGRAGADKLVAFRWADGAFRPVATRRIRVARGAGIDANFLGVDGQGRFWAGLLAGPAGALRARGVVLVDGNLPRVAEFHSGVRARRGSASATAPDNLSTIEFDPSGAAWFSGVEGAAQITAGEARRPGVVRVFREPQGMRGDLANDVVRGPQGLMYVSTPEGFGRWDGRAWDFAVTGASAITPAVAMAGDDAAVYGVGPRGAWIFDESGGRRLPEVDRAGAGPLRDVAVDGAGRVWILGDDGLLQFDPSARPRESGEGSGGESEPEPSSSPAE